MEYIDLLDVLEELVNNGKKSLVGSRVSVDRDELLDIVNELRNTLPEEIKRARRVVDERKTILENARQEAGSIKASACEDAEIIIKEAENKRMELVDNHQITQLATQQGRDIIDEAQKKARDMRIGAREYVDSLLEEFENYLGSKIQEVQTNRNSLK